MVLACPRALVYWAVLSGRSLLPLYGAKPDRRVQGGLRGGIKACVSAFWSFWYWVLRVSSQHPPHLDHARCGVSWGSCWSCGVSWEFTHDPLASARNSTSVLRNSVLRGGLFAEKSQVLSRVRVASVLHHRGQSSWLIWGCVQDFLYVVSMHLAHKGPRHFSQHVGLKKAGNHAAAGMRPVSREDRHSLGGSQGARTMNNPGWFWAEWCHLVSRQSTKQ